MAPEATEVVNLFTAGSGILDTHVTWEDIENNMQNALGTKATFGAKKTLANIGDGKGMLSRICLIEADWQNVEEGAELPAKFIAKVCTLYTMMSATLKAMEGQVGMEAVFQPWIDMIAAMETDVKDMHNCEVNVYSLFEKNELQEKMAMCKIYHLQKFTEEEPLKGHILMEHVGDLQSVHIYDNLPVEALHQPLRSLAAMEAASLRFTDEERSWFKTKPMTEIFGKFLGEDQVEGFTTTLKAIEDGKLNDDVDRLLTNIKSILDLKKYDEIPATLGMRPVLCHGDLWSPNVLWRKEEEHYKMAAIIDYQTSHFGAPAIDMCRLINTSLSEKDRREHSAALLEKYYGYLVEELNGDEAPYTFKQLKEAVELFFPLSGYMVLPLLTSERLRNDAIAEHPEQDHKDRVLKRIFDKTDCLLKDVLDCLENHNSN